MVGDNFTDSCFHNIISCMIRIDRKHRKAIEDQANRFLVHRSQHRMLMYLSKNDNTISQKKISEDMEISPAAVAVTLKKLEHNGLIIREVVECDNRSNSINLSEKGKSIVKESILSFSEVDKNMFADFNDDELKQLTLLLNKIEKNIDKYNNIERMNLN